MMDQQEAWRVQNQSLSLEEGCQRVKVLQEAKTWIGTPYHERANKKGVGVDCVMLLIEVYNSTGVLSVEDPRPYPRDWFLHKGGFERFIHGVEEHCTSTELYTPGNIVLWQVGRAMAHGGIITDWPLVIHANPRYKCVAEEMARRTFIGKTPHVIYNPWGKQ